MTVKKLKGSAVQYAITIAVLIAMLLGALLMLSHTHQLFRLQSQKYTEVINAAFDGIKIETVVDEEIASYFKNDSIPLTVSKEAWGAFERITSTAKSHKKRHRQSALLGGTNEELPTSVYVTNSDKPLILAGNARLQGDAYVSRSGIVAATLNQLAYTGASLVDGEIKIGRSILPELKRSWLESSLQWLRYSPKKEDSLVRSAAYHGNSFQNPTAILYNQNTTIEQDLRGNIAFISSQPITIKKWAQLHDVLIVAPQITVEKGFAGNAHFLASEWILLEEDVELAYPSSLVVMDTAKERANDTSAIYLSKDTRVQGAIVYINKGQEVNYFTTTSVFLEENVRVMGQVYCEGNTELLGTVYGSVYTKQFTATVGSRYNNHLYNGKVLAYDIPDGFCGLLFESSKKGIAQWLY